MADSNTHKFAIVKWLAGDDCGKRTIILTEWIRDFAKTDLDYEESYIVEWRCGKKRKNGWPVYDASLISTAGIKNPPNWYR